MGIEVEAVEQGAAEATGAGTHEGDGAGGHGRLPTQDPAEATGVGKPQRLMGLELAELEEEG